MTITEALADLKTLSKRIEKKREGLAPYIMRRAIVVDPLQEQGGSKEHVKRELQSITDMELRMVAIRTAIQQVNLTTGITVDGETKTIAAWLTWRKEIAQPRLTFIGGLRQLIVKARTDYQKKGGTVADEVKVEAENVFVNLDELELVKESDHMTEVLGTLDGQLSLKNATTIVPGI